MFTNKQYQQAIQNAAVDALTTGTGVMSQGVIAGGLTASNHAADAYSYTINNTANQTLNSVQIGAQRQNHNIVFHGPNGKEVGRFDFNGGELKFDGQADISAQVFIEWARKTFNERVLADKREMLKEVMDALVHESTGALYEDAEKLAILTCIQRVQEIQRSVEPAQVEMDYSANLAKSMMATKNAVASSIIGSAFGGQP
jgi:hypothetical protein